MNLPPIANYETPRKAFVSLLEPGGQHRILLLRGETEKIGKSFVLHHCRIVVPPDNLCAVIELRPEVDNIAELIARIGDLLTPEQRPRLTAALAALEGPLTLSLTNVSQWGLWNRINNIVQSPHSQKHSRSTLMQALFDDLKSLQQPVLIVIDSFERAQSDEQDWIAGPLLARVANAGSVRAVIAGCRVPEPTLEWSSRCQLEELTGVRDAQHWMTVAVTMKRQIRSLDYLQGYCDALEGRPVPILRFILSQPEMSAS
jgi:AAA ATPase domain